MKQIVGRTVNACAMALYVSGSGLLLSKFIQEYWADELWVGLIQPTFLWD